MTEEMEKEYIRRFFDYHISNNTSPTVYLTWKTLQKMPALMTNDQLDGLDWDTITGLFDRVGVSEDNTCGHADSHQFMGGM